MNTKDVWDRILEDGGSVQGLDFLDEWVMVGGDIRKVDEPREAHELAEPVKEVFKTFRRKSISLSLSNKRASGRGM
jgi:hypothetical protein